MVPLDRDAAKPVWKVLIKFGVPVLSLLLSLFLLIQFPVSAVSSYLFHPGFGTAVIDGYIETSEWAAADSYSHLMSASSMTGTLYVMQSSTDLYLGFVIDDDELTTGDWFGILGDTVEIFFDDNNSGSLYEVGENKFTVFSVDPWFYDSYIYNTSGSSNYDTTQTGGQTNGEGNAARHGDDNHFEARIPLCSGDAYDFCLSPGDIIGLHIQYDDMYPDDPVSVIGVRYPEASDSALVTIEISSNYIYLPLMQH